MTAAAGWVICGMCHGHDALGIDLDERNAELAEQRIGPFLFDRVNSADAGRAIQRLGRVHTGEQ